MAGFGKLLRENRNYRHTWMGQVVSEVGDHFNNIAVFSLAMHLGGSGMVVTGVMLARAIPAVLTGPLAGVALDRFDRKRIMVASDLIRAVIALGFILTLRHGETWLLYMLSALLMIASPFFTAGRSSILPTIASKEELHAANSLTQTTQWSTITIGAFLGGISVAHLGFEWAFVFNALSFLFSAWSISRLKSPTGHFRAERKDLAGSQVVRPWHEYTEGLRYMRSFPLILALGLINVGWATGGGAAQVLFPLFGELVFGRGASGTGTIWGFAGVGLLIGGAIGHWLGKRLSFDAYKRTVVFCYLIHGGAYVIFSLVPEFWQSLIFIALSRAAIGVSSVLNFAQLLRHVSDNFRGRIFSTIESMTWCTMMLSMMGAGIASQSVSIRSIGVASGVLSSTTALFWAWANLTGRLPEPAPVDVDPDDIDVRAGAKV
jgi:MFS family permease